MLLPGRNVMRLAGQLASVDALSGGRLLVTFVPGIDRPPEGSAIGVPVAERRAVIAEAMPLLRRLLAGETVSHRGPVADLDQVTLSPLPVQQPLEFWLGGMAPRSLELCGRLGDGWLPSLCTPEAAREGRAVIERSASEAGRAIDPEHFGVSIGYSRTALDAAATERIAARARGADLSRLVPIGLPALRSAIEEFVSVGFSKFVVRPMDLAPDAWPEELADLADAVLDLQS
jgi:probable F420-dependent oxidoreductase